MSSTPLPMKTRWLGAAFTFAGILFQAWWLGLPAIFLSVALVVAYGLWVGSDWHVVPRLNMAFGIGILIFVVHIAEEYSTGLHVALPELFGRAPWTEFQYTVFIGAWFLVFAIAAGTVRIERSLSVLVLLFFAVAAGVGNGVLHPLLVLERGAYFPGAWTSPLCLIIGIWLLRLLYAEPAETSGRHDNGSAPGGS